MLNTCGNPLQLGSDLTGKSDKEQGGEIRCCALKVYSKLHSLQEGENSFYFSNEIQFNIA